MATHGGKRPLITVVDDDKSIRDSLRMLFESAEFEVDAFASAEDFLSSGNRSESTCLILDVQLPGISGIELQNRLRAEGDITTVVFITAHPEDHIWLQAIEGGAIRFFSKPFSGAELLSVVRDYQTPND